MPKMTNTDLRRLLRSQEIRRQLRPVNRTTNKRKVLKKNPLKNARVMFKLNPYAKSTKRSAKLAEERSKRQDVVDKKREVCHFPDAYWILHSQVTTLAVQSVKCFLENLQEWII